MKAVRSDVDDWLLDFIIEHKFSRKDFYEKSDGGIRLTFKITPYLSETIPVWREKIEPIIKRVKEIMTNDISFEFNINPNDYNIHDLDR